MEKGLKINCPNCRAEVDWSDNPSRPFCSERCRLIDLGQWSDESYRIPGASQQPLSDENIIPFDSAKDDY